MAKVEPRAAYQREGDAMNGAELIAAERQRQIDAEGWTPEHDDEHVECEMLRAALCYAEAAGFDLGMEGSVTGDPPLAPHRWPWDESWWKPYGEPVRNLVKAGALIAAEIDRLSRRHDHRIPWTDGEIPPHGFEDEWAAIQRNKGLVVVPDDEHTWRLG